MAEVSAHFDFSGFFWIALAVVVVSVLFRKEIPSLVERVKNTD